MADLDRQTLFANEALVIGMLQVVSGGSIVASLSQADVIILYAGRISFFLFVTFSALALILAVLAAYWKHQYKMWDVKAGASQGEATYYKHVKNDTEKEREYYEEATRRGGRAYNYLSAMRRAILLAVLSIIIAITQLVSALWYQELCGKDVPNKALQPTSALTRLIV